jgi:hypothetical protein
VPPPLDLNPVSLVCPLVAAFRLVSAMTRNRLMVLEFAASFANACWQSILNHGDNEILWRCTIKQPTHQPMRRSPTPTAVTTANFCQQRTEWYGSN